MLRLLGPHLSIFRRGVKAKPDVRLVSRVEAMPMQVGWRMFDSFFRRRQNVARNHAVKLVIGQMIRKVQDIFAAGIVASNLDDGRFDVDGCPARAHLTKL